MIRGSGLALLLVFAAVGRGGGAVDTQSAGVTARLGTPHFRHGAAGISLQIVQDGRWLLSASADGTARLWDARTGLERGRFRHQPASQRWVDPQLSANGRIIVTRAKNFHVWDVGTGKEVPWSPGNTPPSGPWAEHADGGARFSADGRTLFLWGGWHERMDQSHGVLESWDIATGKRTHRFLLPWGLVPSPDCTTFAVVTPEALQLRSVAGNKLLREWKGKIPSMHWLPHFSPDGKYLTAVDWDTVVTWDLADGKESYRMRMTAPQADTPYAGHLPFFSADGKSMVARQQFEPWDLWIWEAATGKIQHKVRTGPATWTRLSPDGKYLVTQHMVVPQKKGGGDDWPNRRDETKLWEVATNKEIARLPGDQTSDGAAAFTPDSKTLFIAYRESSSIAVFDIPSGKQRHPVGPVSPARELAFSRDGRSLASWDFGDAIRVWDVRTGKQQSQTLWPANKWNRWSRVFWGPNDRLQILAAQFNDMSACIGLQLSDVETGKAIRSFSKKLANYGNFAISGDGRLLAQDIDQEFVIWDMTTGREIETIAWQRDGQASGGRPDIVFAPNGKMLAARGVAFTNQQHRPWFAVWELASGKERWRLEASQLPEYMNLSGNTMLMVAPDSRHVLLTDHNSFHLWDLARNKEIRRFGGRFGATSVRAAIAPDGKLLAAMRNDPSYRDGWLGLWDVHTGTPLEPIDHAPNQITAFAFSPDCKTLAIACTDTTILLWDVAHLLARNTKAPRPVGALWADLGAEDGATAFKAMTELERQPAETLAFFKKTLKPIAPADPKQVARLLADFQSDAFAMRARAQRDLEQLGDLAVPALRELHKKPPPLETRRRLEELLPKLEGPARAPDLLRVLRAIEVLQQIGSSDARELLLSLADGAPHHRVTQAARDALPLR